MIGDGEAETGPLATAWHSNKFLNPVTDGAVLPILHLNGYKIANPTILARISRPELESLLTGYGYRPYVVEGDEPEPMHQAMAATLDAIVEEIRAIQRSARAGGPATRPRWPALVLVTPKGWTGPEKVDGKKTEGSWRSHQVPLANLATNPEHVRQLETWMRSYRPEELFDDAGRLRAELAELAPTGARRMGANPHANGGLLLEDLRVPDFRQYAVEVPKPGVVVAEATRVLGRFLRDVMTLNRDRRNFRVFGPDETASNRLDALFEVDRPHVDGRAAAGGRAPGPRGAGDGDPQRAHLPGMARGLPARRAPWPLLELRGLHPHRRLDVQPARQVAEGDPGDPVARARSRRSTTC